MKQFMLVTLTLLLLQSSAQENQESFLSKTKQHSVSASFAAASYSYAYQFESKMTFGASAQVGFANRYFLMGSSFKYSQKSLENGGKSQYGDTHEFGDYFVDLIKIHVFYRPIIGKHIYFDLGPYISFGYLNAEDYSGNMSTNGGISVGLETAVYYQFWKMHVGTKLSAGYQYVGNSDGNVQYTALFSTPLVIGFNF